MEEAMDYIRVNKSPSPSCACTTSRVPVEKDGDDCNSHKPVSSLCGDLDQTMHLGRVANCQEQLAECNRHIRELEEATNNNSRLIRYWTEKQQKDWEAYLQSRIAEINQEWHQKTQNFQACHQAELASLQKQFSEAQALVQQLESSLTTEQTNRVSAEAEALENHKRWRKTAAELRKLYTTTCQSNKISDQDLIDAAKRMRWMVRNLAATGFSEILGEPSSDKTRLSTYPRPMTEDLRQMQFFLHTNQFPIYFEASLWHYLTKYVFGRYMWAGEAAESMQKLYSAVYDSPTEKIAISLQEWRTNTNALVATTAATTPAARKALLAYRADFAYSMLRLGNYRRGNPGLADELATIFDAAISLDRDIHLRNSAVEWQVLPPGQNKFDPDTMVVENDGVISSRVLVVLAPGLIKKGHDAVGDDVLCKMEVVCEVDRVANESQANAPTVTIRDNGRLNWIHGLKKLERHFTRKVVR
ncbi:uncharacterized protein PgNI_12252 [Pyricularia grisea]|uniref:Uncharacterized protein n=1 Tax=Pyricularia grisea TaxID=148305 RepID=A0A6P8AMS8_PYRGI|nr:uncharacterized protein PgNI_12252 [Pyricularia grisea]TLD03326.1 hypothetical protein PgNI_12252 [Pyricularia grisea]